MAGLNYGRRYTVSNQNQFKEGVTKIPGTGKWLVRVKRKDAGTLTSIGKFDTEEEANDKYKNHSKQ